MADQGQPNQKLFFNSKAAIFCVLVIAFLFVFKRIVWSSDIIPYIEGIAIGVVFILLFSFRTVHEYIKSLPKGLQIIYIILFFIFYAAHVIHIPRASFPFVPWKMFSYPAYTSEVRFYEYFGYTESGKEIKLFPPRYFKSLASSRIVTDLDKLLRLINHRNEEDIIFQKQKYASIEKNSPLNGTGMKGIIKNFTSGLRLSVQDKPLLDLDQTKLILNERLTAIATKHNKEQIEYPLVKIKIYEGMIDISERPDITVKKRKVWEIKFSE